MNPTSTETGRRARLVRPGRMAAAAAVLAAGISLVPVPSQAHGTGLVKSCIRGTDCTTNSANNAVFAICDPKAATSYPCSHSGSTPGPRPVTIQLRNFGNGATVHVWWLNSEVDSPAANDCTQVAGAGRTHLGDATMSASGGGSLDADLPPGNTPAAWSYGTNWICATTAGHSGGPGTIGDQQFAIYPA